MENCENCPCSCKPITNDCIEKYSAIQDACVLNPDDYSKATDDIDDLIGSDCAEQLCDALTQAAEDAATNDNTISDNLAQIWLDIINNRHFQSWYANRLLFHWVFGASISKLTQEGLVNTSNTDTQYKNGYVHSQENERKRIQDSAQFYSDKARTKFLDKFWHKNLKRYPCYELECGCTKSYKCNLHCPPPPKLRSVIL